MTTQLKKELIHFLKYPNSVGNGNRAEIIQYLESSLDTHCVYSVGKEDLYRLGLDARWLTDEEMQRIATYLRKEIEEERSLLDMVSELIRDEFEMKTVDDIFEWLYEKFKDLIENDVSLTDELRNYLKSIHVKLADIGLDMRLENMRTEPMELNMTKLKYDCALFVNLYPEAEKHMEGLYKILESKTTKDASARHN